MTSNNGHGGHVTVEGTVEAVNERIDMPHATVAHIRAAAAMEPIIRKIALSRFRLVDKFWAQVAAREPSECWLWTGRLTANGYGQHGWGNVAVHAHRIAWILTYGPIPDGLVVRHLVCDNRPCCNPAHLAIGTHADNAADRVAKGRSSGNHTRYPGEANPSAKLTNADVSLIREQLRNGTSQAELARQLGMSKSAICHIAKGKAWTSVP